MNLDWSKCQPYSGVPSNSTFLSWLGACSRGSYGWWRAPRMSQLAASVERCLGRPSRWDTATKRRLRSWQPGRRKAPPSASARQRLRGAGRAGTAVGRGGELGERLFLRQVSAADATLRLGPARPWQMRNDVHNRIARQRLPQTFSTLFGFGRRRRRQRSPEPPPGAPMGHVCIEQK